MYLYKGSQHAVSYRNLLAQRMLQEELCRSNSSHSLKHHTYDCDWSAYIVLCP